MENRIQGIIYKLTTKNDYVTSYELAKLMNVSSRTIKNDMKHIEDRAEQIGCHLISKQGLGYKLEVYSDEVFSEYFLNLKIKNIFLSSNYRSGLTERQLQMFQLLLCIKKPMLVDQLVDRFYLSESVIRSELNKLQIVARENKLNLESNKDGIVLKGDEFNKRICMLSLVDYMFHKITSNDTDGNRIKEFNQYFEIDLKELDISRQILLKFLREFKYPISDNFTQYISRYLILMRKRSILTPLNISSELKKKLLRFETELEISSKIINSIGREYNIVIEKDEIFGLEILLIIWKDYGENYLSAKSNNHNEVEKITEEVVKEIVNQFALNFNIKSQLKRIINMLCNVSLLSCEHFNLDSVLFSENRIVSPFASIITEVITKHIQRYYKNSISRYWRDYLVNQISLVLLELSYDFEPVKIAISSSSGLEGAKLIRKNINQIFSRELIKSIECLELYEGRIKKNSEYDFYIVNGIPSITYSYEWPLVSVNYPLNGMDVSRIYERISDSGFNLSKKIQTIFSKFKVIFGKKKGNLILEKFVANDLFFNFIFNPDASNEICFLNIDDDSIANDKKLIEIRYSECSKDEFIMLNQIIYITSLTKLFPLSESDVLEWKQSIFDYLFQS